MNKFEIRNQLINLIKVTPKIIDINLKTKYKYLKKRDLYFELEEYVDNFLDECNPNNFFVIPGLRGVGKTTILYQLYYHLIHEKGIDERRVLYLDLDRFKNQHDFDLLNYLDVFTKDINEEYYLTTEALFIFIDESQYASNWALTGKIIFDENPNVFLIFTGSNALNLESNKDSVRRSTKKQLYPLNFREYLELKYNLTFRYDISNVLYDMLITGDVSEAIELEKKIQLNDFFKVNRDINKEWEDFLKYGSLPSTLRKEKENTISDTVDMKDRILEKDLDLVTSINSQTRLKSYSLVNILATQKPGELSLNNLASTIDLSKKSIEKLLKSFEKTQLIFHIEGYGSSSKRERKAWEYYFLATQIKASIFISNHEISRDPIQYIGIFTENLVASLLYILKQKSRSDFGIFYDSKKGGVDFIINTIMGKTIPIEVGIGKKNKKQIKKAINNYKSDYGIVISNRTNQIIKEDNVIFVPLVTFSMI